MSAPVELRRERMIRWRNKLSHDAGSMTTAVGNMGGLGIRIALRVVSS